MAFTSSPHDMGAARDAAALLSGKLAGDKDMMRVALESVCGPGHLLTGFERLLVHALMEVASLTGENPQDILGRYSVIAENTRLTLIQGELPDA